MVRFNQVTGGNNQTCYKSDAFGIYPSFFLGKARDFKTNLFPFLTEFTASDVELTEVPNCDIGNLLMARDKARIRVEQINHIFYQNLNRTKNQIDPLTNKPIVYLTDEEYETLVTEKSVFLKMITEYYSPLIKNHNGNITEWGGSRRKKRRKERRKRRTRRSRF